MLLQDKTKQNALENATLVSLRSCSSLNVVQLLNGFGFLTRVLETCDFQCFLHSPYVAIVGWKAKCCAYSTWLQYLAVFPLSPALPSVTPPPPPYKPARELLAIHPGADVLGQCR